MCESKMNAALLYGTWEYDEIYSYMPQYKLKDANQQHNTHILLRFLQQCIVYGSLSNTFPASLISFSFVKLVIVEAFFRESIGFMVVMVPIRICCAVSIPMGAHLLDSAEHENEKKETR